MSLCSMRELLDLADKNNRAVGAFNVVNMESVRGIVQAAEETQTPVILQIAEKRLAHVPLELAAPMMMSVARESSVHIAVHLDHGSSDQVINKAMAYGFSSVMFDGSILSIGENKKRTAAICKKAASMSINVEAELGVVGGDEGGGDTKPRYTNPEEVRFFCKDLPIDALAVAIGNAHGHYKGTPHLNFDIVRQIRAITDVPLVLHGGSGISDEDFRKSIDAGIRKINIATTNMDAMLQCTKHYFEVHGSNADFFELTDLLTDAVYKVTLHHIRVFNNKESLEIINQTEGE